MLSSKLLMSMFWFLMTDSSCLYCNEFLEVFLMRVMMGMKNWGLMTYILGYLYETSTIPVLYRSLSGSSMLTRTAYSHPFSLRSLSNSLKKSSFLCLVAV